MIKKNEVNPIRFFLAFYQLAVPQNSNLLIKFPFGNFEFIHDLLPGNFAIFFYKTINIFLNIEQAFGAALAC